MDKDTEKVLATLSYPIPVVMGIILALVAKTKYGKLHGWQGFFWGIFLLLANIILGWMWVIGNMLFSLFSLAWLVFSIIFAVKAFKQENFEIPLIATIVKNIMKK